MKRIFRAISIALLTCVLISGCGRIPKEVAEYKEWYEALQISEHKELKYDGFGVDENRLSLGIICAAENIGELSDIVNKHNEFVEANPEYFGDDIEIHILSSQGSPVYSLNFYNKAGEYYGEKSGEGIAEGKDIKYLSANLFDLKESFEKGTYEFSIPVLVLTVENPESVNSDDLEFLKGFTNLRQIIIYYNALGYDMTPTLEGINKYAPGVEVYQVVDGGELQKWQ